MKRTIVDASQLELTDKVVTIKRVTKVVKGGRNMKFTALVVVGDGNGHVGVGLGAGDEKAMDAVKQAVESKLLETNINNARAVLLNITAGNYTMYDEQTISEYIVSQTGRGVNLIIGSNDVEDADMQEKCKVVLIATGIDEPLSHSCH